MVHGYTPRGEDSRYISSARHPSEGDSCFSIYQNNGKKCTLFSKKQYNVNLFLLLARVLPVILTFTSKSANSLGYRELRDPIRARENGYRLLW